MKKFEYMRNDDIHKRYDDSGMKDFTVFMNKLGAEGWEIMPEPRPNSFCGYFARREIDDSNVQRTIRREVEYSRA
ncbi:MAG: hypothetical protein J5647_03860 [Spirochaetaceae bacterium]|nr:hypothetical protein [Spirochaetaceae bacterium]